MSREPEQTTADSRRKVPRAPSRRIRPLLAVACAANRDHAGALAAMGRAVELDPGNAEYQRFHQRLEEEQ